MSATLPPSRRRRGPARWVAAALLALPVLELYVLIRVGALIGAWQTVGLVLLLSVVGVAVVVHQGRAALAALARRLGPPGAPPPPGPAEPLRPTADAALVVLAGLLLALPGLVTDVAGLVLLVPPTRALVLRLGGPAVRRRTTRGATVVPGEVVTAEVVTAEVVTAEVVTAEVVTGDALSGEVVTAQIVEDDPPVRGERL